MNDSNNELICHLNDALAKAQGEFSAITKNRQVTIRPKDKSPYSFRYADLEEINSATRPALSKNGLALIQPIRQEEGGTFLYTILTHKDGASIESRIKLPELSIVHDPKSFGAMISYIRRYCAQSILGVSADDDLDEDGEPATTIAEDERKFPKATQNPVTPNAGAREGLTKEQLLKLENIKQSIVAFLADGRDYDAYELTIDLTNEEKLGLWSKLDSTSKAAIRKASEFAKGKQ